MAVAILALLCPVSQGARLPSFPYLCLSDRFSQWETLGRRLESREEENPACFSPSVSASSGLSSNSCILSGCPDPIRKSLT